MKSIVAVIACAAMAFLADIRRSDDLAGIGPEQPDQVWIVHERQIPGQRRDLDRPAERQRPGFERAVDLAMRELDRVDR